jgi:hypothetical protein
MSSAQGYDEMVSELCATVDRHINTIRDLHKQINELQTTGRQTARDRDRAYLALAMARGDGGAWPPGWTSPWRLQWNAPGGDAWISAAVSDNHIVGWMLYWIGPNGSYSPINKQPYPDLLVALEAYQAKVAL